MASLLLFDCPILNLKSQDFPMIIEKLNIKIYTKKVFWIYFSDHYRTLTIIYFQERNPLKIWIIWKHRCYSEFIDKNFTRPNYWQLIILSLNACRYNFFSKKVPQKHSNTVTSKALWQLLLKVHTIKRKRSINLGSLGISTRSVRTLPSRWL
jgi:hypothetical protein